MNTVLFEKSKLRRPQSVRRQRAMQCHTACLAGALFLIAHSSTAAAGPAPLEVETKILLPDVHGRIDHLAFDPGRQRVFVAELGNDTVGVIDMKDRKVLRTLTGFHEPQGIAFVASTDTVYIANARDGSVHLLQGAELTPAGQIELKEDADNVRADDAAHRVFVGYGSGALAVIDVTTKSKIGDIPLKAHPESMQLENSGERIFVNVPNAQQIAVVDRATNQQIAAWSTGDLHANFPLALDPERHWVFAVFRHPARVAAYNATAGRLVSSIDTCRDSDDVFVDSKRQRLYAICGAGFVDVLSASGNSLTGLNRVATSSGARTGLFIPQLDRLVVAARATTTEPAALWVLRPSPGAP